MPQILTLPPEGDHSGLLLKGRTALITGGSVGIGFQTAIHLAKRGAHVVITSRSSEKGTAAAANIASQAGVAQEQVDSMVLEISSGMAKLQEFASAYLQAHDRLDFFILNAGGFPKSSATTEDGFEQTYFERVLSVHGLTALLWDRLVASGTAEKPARVIITSGLVYLMVKEDSATMLKWMKEVAGNEIENRTPCKGPPHKAPTGPPAAGIMVAMAQSWVAAMGKRAAAAPDTHIVFASTNPGNCADTDLAKSILPAWLASVMGFVMTKVLGGHSASEGSLPNVAVCVLGDNNNKETNIIPQGAFVGPQYNTYGPPVRYLLESSGSTIGEDATKWKALVEPAISELGELILTEATKKSKLSIPLEAPAEAK